MQADNLKRRLAYSTVSQLSYVTLGAAMFHPLGVIGGAMHIAMHAFGKITLFFCAGAIYVATGKVNVSQLDGLLGGRLSRLVLAVLLLIDGGGYPAGGSIVGCSSADVAIACRAPVVIVGRPGVGVPLNETICTAPSG